MPRTDAEHQEACAEVERYISSARAHIAESSSATLVHAQHELAAAHDTLQRVNTLSDEGRNLTAMLDVTSRDWDAACRRPTVRLQVLRGLAPRIDGPSDMMLWGLSGFATKAFGDVILASLAPMPDTHVPRRPLYHLLWLPRWAIERVRSSGLVEIFTEHGDDVAATLQEAEIASSLWDPLGQDSAYRELHAAHDAAQALLNRESLQPTAASS